MSELKEINSDDLTNLIQSNKLVLIDFWAPWCGPCKMQTPILENLNNSDLDVIIAKLNTDENQTAMKYGIMSIPTLLLFKDGQVVDQIVGAVPKQMIAEKLDYFAQGIMVN